MKLLVNNFVPIRFDNALSSKHGQKNKDIVEHEIVGEDKSYDISYLSLIKIKSHKKKFK